MMMYVDKLKQLKHPTLANGRGRSIAPSCRGYELWQQPRFIYIHIEDIFLKKISLEVEMHIGIP